MDLKKYFKHKTIAVVMGGWSAESAISRRTGLAVAKALEDDGFTVARINLTRDLPAVLKRKKVHFVFIALHGPYGEDGTVQGLLDILGIPYSGEGVLASAVCMDKIKTKCIWKTCNLPTPEWWEVDQSGRVRHGGSNTGNVIAVSALSRKLPLVVKPSSQGSAVGTFIVKNRKQLVNAIRQAQKYKNPVLIERYVKGREVTVGILGDTPFEVIEIKPKGSFYDFTSKYAAGGSRHIIPAGIPPGKRTLIRQLAVHAYRAAGCSVMGRVDMLLDRSGQPYLLEVNTIPGMTTTSLLPDAARYHGISFTDLVKNIISLSLRKSV